MDRYVIKNLKHNYRKKSMQRHLRKLELDEAISDVNLLDCINMLYNSTISNCFRKVGFRILEINKDKNIFIYLYIHNIVLDFI